MRDVAAWVMGERYRQIFLICALALLPALKFVSIGVATAGVISSGVAGSIPVLLTSFGILAVAGLVGPTGGYLLAVIAAIGLGVAALMGYTLRRTGSYTLTVQRSVLVSLLAVIGFFVAVGDATAFWVEALPAFVEWSTPATSAYEAESVRQMLEPFAPFATGMMIAVFWMLAMAGLACGYFLFDMGQDEGRGRFGRFRSLNLGKVLAALLLVLAVVSSLLKSQGLLMNLAIAAFVTFGLHGLALVHWARHRWQLPWAIVPVVYVMAPLGRWHFVCIVGYIDAWFNFSRRQVEPSDT